MRKENYRKVEKSRWIWFPGDYEIYHSVLLHSRREEFGAEYPSMWGLSNVWPRVDFEKNFNFTRDGYIIIHANCKCYALLDGVRYPRGERIPVSSGNHRIEVVTIKTDGLPAIYCESDQLISDRSWKCSPGTLVRSDFAGDEPAYFSPDDDVQVFPFDYYDLKPESSSVNGIGTTYDFGREQFAALKFSCDKELTVIYGETYEEATDPENATLYEKVGGGSHLLVPRAFRYVTFTDAAHDVVARAELLHENFESSFSCDLPEVERIFDICKYTFHLNSREFLLDGIKRDRWCWSGDAYQSYMVNDYLFADRALNRRTITALYGKPPVLEHVNRINDYSALLIIGTWEYYFTTGDAEFIKFIYPRARALYEFIVSRLDEDGLVVERPGDWIFIDWSDIDRSGPLCAEQILLWQTHKAMAELTKLAGKTDEEAELYNERASALQTLIFERFWDERKKAFIDSYTSGKRHVTRHANIFAILFDFVPPETQSTMIRSVLENDAITKITTPYFEFFELMAFCKLGKIEYAQKMINSYWGGMLNLGATTIWEQYDPNDSGIEHYGMYGAKFGKSLCHAWGSGPVYLLGRYCVGVKPTSPGGATFEVKPNLGMYKEIHGTFPIGNGTVTLNISEDELSVHATVPGGTLIWNGQEIKIEQGTTLTVKN